MSERSAHRAPEQAGASLLDAYAFRRSQRANTGRAAAVLVVVAVLYYGLGLLVDAMWRTWVDTAPVLWRHGWDLQFLDSVAASGHAGRGFSFGGWFAALVGLVVQAWGNNLAALATWQKVPFATLGLLGFVTVRTVMRLRNPLAFFGPKMKLRAPHRDDQQHDVLLNVCNEVRVGYGKPERPIVRIVESSVPNALTVGFRPSDSHLLVTSALLEHMPRDELRAVVAHEFFHVYSGDARLSLFINALTHWFVLPKRTSQATRNPWSEDRSSQRDSSRSSDVDLRADELVLRLLPVVLGVVVVVAITLAVAGALYLVQKLGAFMAARSREYLADAGAVDVLRDPDSVARAIARATAVHMAMPDEQEEQDFYQHQRSQDFFVQPELARVRHSGVWHSQPSMVERLQAIGVSPAVLQDVWPSRGPMGDNEV